MRSSPGSVSRREAIRLSSPATWVRGAVMLETTAIHSDRMKSHVVSARSSSRVSAIYKAMPKGRVTRRICEAVSGSTDLWDGSRA